MHRLLDFLASLLEHPCAKVSYCLSQYPPSPIPFPSNFISYLSLQDDYFCSQAVLLKEGVPQMLIKVLKRCFEATDSDGKQFSDQLNSVKIGFTPTGWCLPVFKSFSLLCCSQTPMQHPGRHDL